MRLQLFAVLFLALMGIGLAASAYWMKPCPCEQVVGRVR